MIKHLLRTRYRIVHDSTACSYKVEYRKWWWPMWKSIDDITGGWYRFGLSSEQDAHDIIRDLQRRNYTYRVKTVYKC